MTLGSIDYAASYFKYKTPTPIQGTPTNKTLKRLKTELRANASSVECDLGGGDHGYLGLVLTGEEYATILPPPAPFVAPAFPGSLTIPPNTTQVAALTLREQHKEDRRKYYECKNVEKALQRHIQDAIEDKYLKTMVNEDTQLIQADIPDVLAHLFETYGKVPSAEVKDKETEIRTMTYHPADPLVMLFNPIEQLLKMSISAGIPYTEQQILDLGITAIKNTRDFERGLEDWEHKPHHEKTWANFKTHFILAKKSLVAIRGPTMQQAGYHQVNLLAQQFKQELDTRDNDILTILKTLETQSLASPDATATAMSTLTPATHQANDVYAKVQDSHHRKAALKR